MVCSGRSLWRNAGVQEDGQQIHNQGDMPGDHTFDRDTDEDHEISGKAGKETSWPWKGGRKGTGWQTVMGLPVPEKEVDVIFENA